MGKRKVALSIVLAMLVCSLSVIGGGTRATA